MGKRDRQDVDMLQNVWDGMEQLMNPMQNSNLYHSVQQRTCLH